MEVVELQKPSPALLDTLAGVQERRLWRRATPCQMSEGRVKPDGSQQIRAFPVSGTLLRPPPGYRLIFNVIINVLGG
jgi:hypothetical protein